jgi:hypothetical protein
MSQNRITSLNTDLDYHTVVSLLMSTIKDEIMASTERRKACKHKNASGNEMQNRMVIEDLKRQVFALEMAEMIRSWNARRQTYLSTMQMTHTYLWTIMDTTTFDDAFIDGITEKDSYGSLLGRLAACVNTSEEKTGIVNTNGNNTMLWVENPNFPGDDSKKILVQMMKKGGSSLKPNDVGYETRMAAFDATLMRMIDSGDSSKNMML